jgi:hypothetical protein
VASTRWAGLRRTSRRCTPRDIGDWYAAHRIGGSFAGSYGHAYGGYWERYHEEHPEWFALQPDGTRDQGNIGNRSRLCVSNPELIAHIAREKIAELQRAAGRGLCLDLPERRRRGDLLHLRGM